MPEDDLRFELKKRDIARGGEGRSDWKSVTSCRDTLGR